MIAWYLAGYFLIHLNTNSIDFGPSVLLSVYFTSNSNETSAVTTNFGSLPRFISKEKYFLIIETLQSTWFHLKLFNRRNPEANPIQFLSSSIFCLRFFRQNCLLTNLNIKNLLIKYLVSAFRSITFQLIFINVDELNRFKVLKMTRTFLS